MHQTVRKAITEQQNAWDKYDHFCEVSELERQIGNYKIREEEYNADSMESVQIICKLAKNQHMTSSEQQKHQ